MHSWEAIQKAADYIELHLKEEIETSSLADLSGLSPFYFQRLFARLVKKPVQEYIKLRRMARVIWDLRETDQTILEIALEYGFSSHSNFTRVFKKTYGITPEEYRKTKPQLNTVIKPEISMQYIVMDEGVPLITGDIVLEITRKVLLENEIYSGFEAEVNTSEQIPVGESTGIDIPGQLWNQYHSKKATIAEYLVPGMELGMSHSANPMRKTFTYFAGGLVRSIPEQTGSDFVSQELAAGEYIVCRVEAENFEDLVTTALDQAGRYLFGTWLPKHSLKTRPFSAEKYYRDTRNCYYMEIWVMIF